MLTTSHPDCVSDAKALLLAEGLSCERIIAVDRDSILYLNGVGRARTAWLHRPRHGGLRVQIEPGSLPSRRSAGTRSAPARAERPRF